LSQCSLEANVNGRAADNDDTALHKDDQLLLIYICSRWTYKVVVRAADRLGGAGASGTDPEHIDGCAGETNGNSNTLDNDAE